MVYDEIVPSSGPKDDIGKLIAKYKSSFYPITNKQGQLALQILSNFPRLIDASVMTTYKYKRLDRTINYQYINALVHIQPSF